MKPELKYRSLEHDEVIKSGDEYDACVDGWRDPAIWKPVQDRFIGTKTRYPEHPSHTNYRRPIK